MMILALLIWVVIGFVATCLVWPIVVLTRAVMNKYNSELYFDGMMAVLEEDDAELEAKYNKFKMFALAALHNVLWPYKLVWLTMKFLPRFDERYLDLVFEKLEKEEHA